MNTSIKKVIILSIAILLIISSCKKTTTGNDEPKNNDPVIGSFTLLPTTVPANGLVLIKVTASDEDGDELSYSFNTDGFISGVGASPIWVAPDTEGNYSIEVIVADEQGGQTTSTKSVTVTAPVTQIIGIVQFATGGTGDLEGAIVRLYNTRFNWDRYIYDWEVEVIGSGPRVPFAFTGIPVSDDYYIEVLKDNNSDGVWNSSGQFYGCYGSFNVVAQWPNANPFQVSEGQTTRCDVLMHIIQ